MLNNDLNVTGSSPTPTEPDKKKRGFYILLIVALVVIFGLELGYIIYKEQPADLDRDQKGDLTKKDDKQLEVKNERGLKAFETAEEFKAYMVAAADSRSNYYGFSMGVTRDMGLAEESFATNTDAIGISPMMKESTAGLGAGEFGSAGEVVDRYSETNVQVQGIDEPDLVKTDGKEIYLSTHFYDRVVEFSETTEMKKIAPYPYVDYVSIVALIKALPLAQMGIDSEIDLYGDLLLKDNVLVVLSYDKIRAYDVTDPKKPVQKWELVYVEDFVYEGARLYDDKIYLVTKTYVGDYTPCPIRPYTINGIEMSIACSDIYHPIETSPVDTTYNIAVLDIASGAVVNKVAILGSSSDSQLYMSNDSLYLSYVAPTDTLKAILGFFTANADLFPAELIAKLNKIVAYDLSNETKMVEFEKIMSNYANSFSNDDSLKLENEVENRMTDYLKKHIREFMQTGIVKINVAGLQVSAQGFVPGDLLNQFSLDEYNGNLRVATTSGGRGSYFFSSDTSINDVYILDKALNVIGSVNDLGAGERIYSVRFIGDKGYVVTFKETDPFYVLNLKNPKAPELAGELKIPGYSSYLHPIKENLILGVGREDQNVKLSLFDVSDPKDPKEIAKYSLKDYWSDILNTHHAFTMDEKYQIFFMPGSNGGYIFSYADNKLTLVKAVSDISAKRGLFINDYFYVIGENNIVVLDEKNWERVKEFELE